MFAGGEKLYIVDPDSGQEVEVIFIRYLTVNCLVEILAFGGMVVKVPCTKLYRK